MTTATNVLKGALDFLSNETSPERLVFRRFDGRKLAKAAKNKTKLGKKDVTTVALKVNPQDITFTKRKIIQKVQTSAPGRFVVFDWGSELTVVTMSGNTGNLLPDAITNGTNPIASTLSGIADVIPPGINGGQAYVRGIAGHVGSEGAYAASYVQRQLMHGLSYFEKLELSPKYKSFKKLEKMFDLADADSDIITLEIDSGAIYRGFFEEFSFTIDAANQWNWKYNITYVILSDLSQPIRRWDDQYGDGKNIK